MDPKIFFKALVAGMAFPAIGLPFFCSLLNFIEPTISSLDINQISTLFIPLFFGIANVAYVRLKHKVRASHQNNLLIITGVVLGIIIAVLHIQTFLLGVFHKLAPYSIVILPIVYALIFRFIIKPINKLLGV